MTELFNAATALQVLVGVVTLLDEADNTMPTTCLEYDVAALADHLVDSITRISASAGVTVAAPCDTSVAPRLTAVGQNALTGWHQRGTTGEVAFAGRTLPAADLVNVIALEFAVHGWDFATAIGADITVPDELAECLLALVHRTITPQSRRIAGFDDPVPISADAPVFDRLLAYTGRLPAQPPLRPRL